MYRHCSAILSLWLTSIVTYGAEPSATMAGADSACANQAAQVWPGALNVLPPEETKLEIVSASPSTEVGPSRESALELRIRYRIKDFDPELFTLDIMAEGLDIRQTIGSDAPSASARVPSPSGEALLCVPFAEWWDNEQIMWPLKVQVVLRRQVGNGASTVAANTEKLTYTSATAPKRERPDLTATIKAESAINGMYYELERAMYLRDLCIERQHATASDFTAIYDAWERKHSALRDEIGDAFFAIYLSKVRGNVPIALSFVDQVKRDITKSIQSYYEQHYQSTHCENYATVLDEIAEDLNDPESLAMMRNHKPAN